jgi:hypothetical protein
LCSYENLHSAHKVINFIKEDEESLEKLISFDESNKELDDNIKKMTNLKNSIEKEISDITVSYKSINEELSKTINSKIEELRDKEKKLKKQLEDKFVEIKNPLEDLLPKLYNFILNAEKVMKSSNTYMEENNIFKKLAYISNISNIIKKKEQYFKMLMKSMNINFDSEKMEINFEEYYFNGIPLPLNIEFKEVNANSIKVVWELNNINLLDFDKNELETKIEIKKENEINFTEYIAGKNTNYLIIWTDLYKIKTSALDSAILDSLSYEEKVKLINKLFEWFKCKEFELLYRGTKDGSSSEIFHYKCDNKGPTLILCKNDKGNIFGGYASISWTSNGNFKSTKDSFIFTLVNIYNSEPEIYPNIGSSFSLYHNLAYGPTFGGGFDLCIRNDFLNNNSSFSKIGHSYQDILGAGSSIFTGVTNNNYINIKLKELEVFQIL